jgi:hypothetical protein
MFSQTELHHCLSSVRLSAIFLAEAPWCRLLGGVRHASGVTFTARRELFYMIFALRQIL